MKQDWEIRKLNEVSTFIMGQAPHSKTYNNDGNGELFIRVGDFGDKYPSSNTYTTNPLVYGKEGDIFLCIVGATCGKVNYGIDGVITRSIAAIRPNEELDQDFLFYYFLGQYELYNKSSEGAAQPILNKTILSSFDFSLPPLDEQKRIVAKLDECFEAIDKARANVEKNLQNAKELFQSQLNQIFSQKGDGWEDKKLGECIKLKSGDGLTAKKMNQDGHYPVYGGNGIAGNHDKYNLEGSQVIIGRVGALCGNVRYVDDKIWLTDNAFKVSKFFYDFDKSFLTYLLNYKNLRNYARQSAQPVISNSSTKDVLLQFPESIELQKSIVNQLDELKSQTQSLESNYQQELDALDELKKSILQKAFNGEL